MKMTQARPIIDPWSRPRSYVDADRARTRDDGGALLPLGEFVVRAGLASLVSVNLLLPPVTARAVVVSPAEMDLAHQWARARFEQPISGVSSLTNLPFSFLYDYTPSAECLATWRLARTQQELDPQRTQHTITWTDPRTGLDVRCVVVFYHDFPTIEWTLYFKNTATNTTPSLGQVQALDLSFARGAGVEFVLHHAIGSPADGSDYGPLETPLGPNATKRLAGARGRPTGADWSYYNLEWGGQGLSCAIGWPGQWAAEFYRDQGSAIRVRAGQETTHFKLLPGESVRSPLVVLQFWKGDWVRAQNVWRRWMMAHSMPRPGGVLPSPQFLASSSRQYDEMIRANETNQMMFIDRYLAERLPLDYWWMDAGWYVNRTGWPDVGTWEVDTNRFPHGLRAISDYAHEHGLKTLVWFEPERVAKGTWLALNHPDWILGGAKGGLLNLGEPAAREWLTEHIDGLIRSQGIDLYRQDFNIEPLDFWRQHDAPDRQGITENHYVTGFLAFWDELRRRHPQMLIDSCASGGRRNDLETMRRAVPLWRSDYAFESTGHQGMTYGLSLWLPFHGTGTVACRNAPYYGSGATPVEPYAFWSNTSPSLGCGIDLRVRELDYASLRRLLGQWRSISADYYGDYWPLTPYSRDPSLWIAWQFDRPEQGQGMVQAFRREKSLSDRARLRLRGLDSDARYRVTQLDSDAGAELTGRELGERGLEVILTSQPAAAIVTYRRIP